jgi:hypothetical protein
MLVHRVQNGKKSVDLCCLDTQSSSGSVNPLAASFTNTLRFRMVRPIGNAKRRILSSCCLCIRYDNPEVYLTVFTLFLERQDMVDNGEKLVAAVNINSRVYAG